MDSSARSFPQRGNSLRIHTLRLGQKENTGNSDLGRATAGLYRNANLYPLLIGQEGKGRLMASVHSLGGVSEIKIIPKRKPLLGLRSLTSGSFSPTY